MPLKSTQTNIYETACFVQEAASDNSDFSKNGYTVHKSVNGGHFCVFESTLWTFDRHNRMQRRYDQRNAEEVIKNDERIQTLKKFNKWRGELNHPNPDKKGEELSSIRMTIPEQTRTSHYITKDKFVGSRYNATIITCPETECGRLATSEIADMGAVPSFSVRLLGCMIPNAPMDQPNMKVHKVITFDMVDFPSHQDANADIRPKSVCESDYSSVVMMRDFAKYCTQQDERLGVVCESFQITPEELFGISNIGGDPALEIHQESSIIRIPLRDEIRREAINVLKGRFL